MAIKVNYLRDTYYVKEHLSTGQTLYMEFYLNDWRKEGRVWFYVYCQIYKKRKKIDEDYSNKAITGLNPIESAIKMRAAFEALEAEILEQFQYLNVRICIEALDARRAKAYAAYLTKKGYVRLYPRSKDFTLYKDFPKIDREAI